MARRMKTFLLVIGLVLVLGVAPALAGKGGNGNGGGNNAITGSIALMADGAARAAAAGPTYGDTVMFDTTVEGKMAPKSRVYITVVCFQGGDVVYQYSGAADASYPLTDQAGQGLEWDGGEADCEARFIYEVAKGKGYDRQWLDADDFHTYSA